MLWNSFHYITISTMSRRLINFYLSSIGKITFDGEKKAAVVQTFEKDERKEMTFPTWINVPLDITISSYYLFTDARTKRFSQVFAKKEERRRKRNYTTRKRTKTFYIEVKATVFIPMTFTLPSGYAILWLFILTIITTFIFRKKRSLSEFKLKQAFNKKNHAIYQPRARLPCEIVTRGI